MRNFITSHQAHRFKLINLDTISFVDFVSADNDPNMPERCVIYFMSGEKISLDNPIDAQGLLEALRSYQQERQ